MANVVLQQNGEFWEVVLDGSVNLTIWDLDFAALYALDVAKIFDVGRPVLGIGAPADALRRGAELRRTLDSYRY